MIETGASLMTWRIAIDDLSSLMNGIEINGTRIADHRKTYLDYQGPVRSGSGRVELYDTGICDCLPPLNERYVIKISGRKLKGELIIDEGSSPLSILFRPDSGS